eukprot:gene15482-biopygen663
MTNLVQPNPAGNGRPSVNPRHISVNRVARWTGLARSGLGLAGPDRPGTQAADVPCVSAATPINRTEVTEDEATYRSELCRKHDTTRSQTKARAHRNVCGASAVWSQCAPARTSHLMGTPPQLVHPRRWVFSLFPSGCKVSRAFRLTSRDANRRARVPGAQMIRMGAPPPSGSLRLPTWMRKSAELPFTR